MTWKVQFSEPFGDWWDSLSREERISVGMYVDLLRTEGVTLRSPYSSGIQGSRYIPTEIRLPSMGHFVIQKGLIHSRRDRNQQVKDLFYVIELLDRAHGLSARCRDEVVAADVRWSSRVDQLIEVLDRRVGETRFLTALAEQYPLERRPPNEYVEREIRTWLEQLQEARVR